MKMKIRLNILRRENSEAEPYIQSIIFESNDVNATVATALTEINNNPDIKDINGKSVTPIRWECSCLQKKCGACAMVINSRPQLACNVQIKEFIEKGSITVEPLKKFPVVADLIVDRSIMLDNLMKMNVWFNSQTKADENVSDITYEASRCLQCGCCLEVCPNFYVGSEFSGTAAAIPTTRIISAVPEEQKKQALTEYKKHFYGGCGKSLACRNICPAGIDVDKLLVRSNAAAVWGRKIGGKRKK